jgi:tRNA nucleotidyltransferase/poly(A) polymerase
LDDIKNKIIRCNGDTLTSFKTNPSNIIRAIRFYSVLGFNFDFDIEEFFDSDKVNLIKEIDKDELQKEINKITSTKEANLRYQTLLKNYPILARALETYS